jgi:hypothetical protein
VAPAVTAVNVRPAKRGTDFVETQVQDMGMATPGGRPTLQHGRRRHGVRWLLAPAPLVTVLTMLMLVACGAPPTTGPQATQTAAAALTQIAGTAVIVATVAGKVSGLEQTAVAPTTAAGATMAVGTIVAGGTVVAATAAAQPTPAVFTTALSPPLAAIATQAAGPGGAALATAVASGPVQITSATVGAPDTRVVVANRGGTMANVGGYHLLFTGFVATIPRNTLVPPGGQVTVHFAPGVNSATDVYLGTGPEIMAESMKPGGRIVLTTPEWQPASVHVIA